jgi:hypothetical protein
MAPGTDAREAGEARRLSVPEINLLLFLDSIDVRGYRKRTGEVEWLLTAEDICSLVELALDLLHEWQPTSSADAWDRAARLLGVPDPDAVGG